MTDADRLAVLVPQLLALRAQIDATLAIAAPDLVDDPPPAAASAGGAAGLPPESAWSLAPGGLGLTRPDVPRASPPAPLAVPVPEAERRAVRCFGDRIARTRQAAIEAERAERDGAREVARDGASVALHDAGAGTTATPAAPAA